MCLLLWLMSETMPILSFSVLISISVWKQNGNAKEGKE